MTIKILNHDDKYTVKLDFGKSTIYKSFSNTMKARSWAIVELSQYYGLTEDFLLHGVGVTFKEAK